MAVVSPESRHKRRWLQFRLRTLLIVVVLLCLGLGGWQIYWTHFANYVVADPVRVGEPIRVRGQLVDFRGVNTTAFAVDAALPSKQATLGWVIYQSGAGRLEKTGRWTSRFELVLPPVTRPGEYRLQFHPVFYPDITGKLRVLPEAVDGE